MRNRRRPLSPHIGIYRWEIGNSLSILNRITGALLSIGLLVLAGWCLALAEGPAPFADMRRWLGNPFGLSILLALSFAFWFHTFNGIRHLVWDAGHGFEEKGRRVGGIVAIATSVAATITTWIVAWWRY